MSLFLVGICITAVGLLLRLSLAKARAKRAKQEQLSSCWKTQELPRHEREARKKSYLF